MLYVQAHTNEDRRIQWGSMVMQILTDRIQYLHRARMRSWKDLNLIATDDYSRELSHLGHPYTASL